MPSAPFFVLNLVLTCTINEYCTKPFFMMNFTCHFHIVKYEEKKSYMLQPGSDYSHVTGSTEYRTLYRKRENIIMIQ